MRALKLIVVGVGTASLLVACNGEDASVEKNNALEETEGTASSEESVKTFVASSDTDDDEVEEHSDHPVIQASDALESYEADVTILASIDNNDPERLELYIRMVNGDSPQLHIRAEDADRTIHTDGKTYHNNGVEWVDITGDVAFEQLHRVTYKSAADLFVTLEDRLEENEEDGKLIYTYSGNDSDIHTMFEEFVGVSFGVVDTTDNENEIQIEIDSETMYITYIDFKSRGEDSQGEFSLESSVEFLEFDNVDDIEAPDVSE